MFRIDTTIRENLRAKLSRRRLARRTKTAGRESVTAAHASLGFYRLHRHPDNAPSDLALGVAGFVGPSTCRRSRTRAGGLPSHASGLAPDDHCATLNLRSGQVAAQPVTGYENASEDDSPAAFAFLRHLLRHDRRLDGCGRPLPSLQRSDASRLGRPPVSFLRRPSAAGQRALMHTEATRNRLQLTVRQCSPLSRFQHRQRRR